MQGVRVPSVMASSWWRPPKRHLNVYSTYTGRNCMVAWFLWNVSVIILMCLWYSIVSSWCRFCSSLVCFICSLSITVFWLAVWLSDKALGLINVVALRQTRFVPGWVTICGRGTISVYNQPARLTQPSTLCGTVNWVSWCNFQAE